MKRAFKPTAVRHAVISVIMVLIAAVFICGCGDITGQDPKLWPKKGPAASVPKPQAGEIQLAVTQEDVDGKAYSIITIENFTADDMGDYIRLLLEKGFETYTPQKRTDNFIFYSATKGSKKVELSLDTDTNEMKIEIQ